MACVAASLYNCARSILLPLDGRTIRRRGGCNMALKRICFPVIAIIMLFLAWTFLKRPGTPAAIQPGPVFASTGTPAAVEPAPDNDKEALEPGKELFTREW